MLHLFHRYFGGHTDWLFMYTKCHQAYKLVFHILFLRNIIICVMKVPTALTQQSAVAFAPRPVLVITPTYSPPVETKILSGFCTVDGPS